MKMTRVEFSKTINCIPLALFQSVVLNIFHPQLRSEETDIISSPFSVRPKVLLEFRRIFQIYRLEIRHILLVPLHSTRNLPVEKAAGLNGLAERNVLKLLPNKCDVDDVDGDGDIGIDVVPPPNIGEYFVKKSIPRPAASSFGILSETAVVDSVHLRFGSGE